MTQEHVQPLPPRTRRARVHAILAGLAEAASQRVLAGSAQQRAALVVQAENEVLALMARERAQVSAQMRVLHVDGRQVRHIERQLDALARRVRRADKDGEHARYRHWLEHLHGMRAGLLLVGLRFVEDDEGHHRLVPEKNAGGT